MFLRCLLIASIILFGAFSSTSRLAAQDFTLTITDDSDLLQISGPFSDTTTFVINGEEQRVYFQDGRGSIQQPLSRKGHLLSVQNPAGSLKLYHLSKSRSGNTRLISLPLWLSIVPPLLAVILALLFKEVFVALFAGIWSGAIIAGGLRIDAPFYILLSILEVVEKYAITALADTGHLSVIVFSLLIGGMVAIISRNGGMAGVVKGLSKYARSSTSAQLITWLLGVAIFFDDYANTLIVGNTMRSVTDRFRISREKLAYIVDSTAAPVAAIAFITTWIGAELGYIDGGIQSLEGFDRDLTPYAIFMRSLKYSFYPILTLGFILMVVRMKRDFGPMHKAEMRARTSGQVSSAATPEEDEPNMEDLSPVEGAPLKWQHAFFPVMTVILMTIFGLISTGMDSLYSELSDMGAAGLTESWGSVWSQMSLFFDGQDVSGFRKLGRLIGSADSYIALLWASFSGVIVALGITLYNRTMKLIDAMDTMITGLKTMMPAVLILTLAWALAITTDELQTATFLSSALVGNLNPYWMPVLVFILASLIAFSTGSSWSTMAILYPIAIPTCWAISQEAGLDYEVSVEILLNVIATVLGASVMGDHCSPISDTTILSSLASDCNHIDHVRTQLPYALVVGSCSILAVFLSTRFGGGWLISLLLITLSFGILFIILMRFGKPVPGYSGDD